jgi:hypothetical protein
LRPRDLWVISTAYCRAVRAPHVAEGFVASGLSLDLLLIFHGMTCVSRRWWNCTRPSTAALSPAVRAFNRGSSAGTSNAFWSLYFQSLFRTRGIRLSPPQKLRLQKTLSQACFPVSLSNDHTGAIKCWILVICIPSWTRRTPLLGAILSRRVGTLFSHRSWALCPS